jgi:glycosyltransferase involved in cell wall biosynthesis
LSILHPVGALSTKANPFGKDVANLELFRALARHGGFEQLDVLSQRQLAEADLRQALFDAAETPTRIALGSVINTALPAASGTLLRGQPDLYDVAWLRRTQAGDTAYSLIGLVHTIAPPFMRQIISMASVGPVQPWDAVICTSPSVRDAVKAMFARWGGHLAERTGGQPPPQPQLPILPLGVDGAALKALADRPEARARRRAALGLAEDAVLALWVGRLSFFEKAFPQPMFRALQRAAKDTGAKITFALAGWFPSELDRSRYEQAAKACAPDVAIRFLDGNDRELLGELWAASDLFLSLVDNIQETFGITPLEAMAAGLPVVASDWDGYRYTMRDGVEAFLIPTLGGPDGGFGPTMVARHVFEIDSYQTFVGSVAQFTAVHVGKAAEAIAALIGDPALRRRMGEAGRARVAGAFDWPVVVEGYLALIDELAAMRAAAKAEPPRRIHPVKGDPFEEFAGFPTQVSKLAMRFSVPPGVGPGDVRRTAEVELDQAFGYWRANLEECAEVVRLAAESPGMTLRQILLAFPEDRRRAVQLGVLWLAKQGFLDWLG